MKLLETRLDKCLRDILNNFTVILLILLIRNTTAILVK
ncbi:MAG: hypothetical protein PWP27_2351 [Clostridiales bacterium]|nr:hypothetical protein [Clostridiales bacterium]